MTASKECTRTALGQSHDLYQASACQLQYTLARPMITEGRNTPAAALQNASPVARPSLPLATVTATVSPSTKEPRSISWTSKHVPQ